MGRLSVGRVGIMLVTLLGMAGCELAKAPGEVAQLKRQVEELSQAKEALQAQVSQVSMDFRSSMARSAALDRNLSELRNRIIALEHRGPAPAAKKAPPSAAGKPATRKRH